MSTITLISGANQGIGLATATSLAKDHGHHVIIGSRNLEAGEKVAASLQAEGYKASSVQLDLSSQSSIEVAVKTIDEKFGRIDVLINNAGVLLDGKDPSQSLRDLLTETFTTNVIGTTCLTDACVPLLRKSSLPRLVFLSSRMGSLSEALNKETFFYAADYKTYDASKAAVAMIALNYDRILADVGARVNVVCPGLVSTNLTGYTSYGMTVEMGARRIVQLANVGKDGPTGTFSDFDGPIPW